MKNIKRTVAVFVSAIMVMAMLAGCGGGNSSSGGGSTESDIAGKLRSMLDAKQSDSLDRVAEALADVDWTTQIVTTACEENGYYPHRSGGVIIDKDEENDQLCAVVLTSDDSSGTVRDDVLSIAKLTTTKDELIESYSDGPNLIKYSLSEKTSSLKEQGYTNIEREFYVALREIDANHWILIFDWCWTYDR